jgi:peptidyl-tRNA hydrolase
VDNVITNNPVLYILMRTDLASMNPGKAVAQGAHAANQFVYELQLREKEDVYYEWEKSTEKGFGTTICLSVDEAMMNKIVEFAVEAGYIAGIVHDPTYPLVDGKVVHQLPLDTCGYVFGRKEDLAALLSQFNLMP